MRFKQIFRSCTAIFIAAILAIAACGCEDLGDYSSVEEYYSSFGDVVLVSGTNKEEQRYSVEKYFYNEDSRENFLEGEDGIYKGVAHMDYVYVAIPFNSEVELDTLSMFLQSRSDVKVYINVYLTRKIPSNLKGLEDIGKEYETEIVYVTTGADEALTETVNETGTANETQAETANETGAVVQTESTNETEVAVETADEVNTEESSGFADETESGAQTETAQETESSEETGSIAETETVYETTTEIHKIEYDDPDPATRIGEITVDLKSGIWTSFTLDVFNLDGSNANSVQINQGQYILLQIRNNSGVRVYDEEKKLYVDPQTGLVLERAEVTMTNLLVRALNVDDHREKQGGE